MKSVITNTHIFHVSPQVSLILKKTPHISNHNKKLNFHLKKLIICSATLSDSINLNGWDESRAVDWSTDQNESNELKNILYSLGIDQKRYLFVYLLGFICALALSRIRVSSIILFPASAIVFAIGFSIGIVNGGKFSENLGFDNKRSKDRVFKVYNENLGFLLGLFDDFENKVSDLKGEVKKGIERKYVSIDDLESYVNVMESMILLNLNGKSVVQSCIDSIVVENVEMEKSSNKKSTKRKKGVDEGKIGLHKFFGNMFRDKSTLVDTKGGKTKVDDNKVGNKLEVNDQSDGNILRPRNEGKKSFSSKPEFFENDYDDTDEIKFSEDDRVDEVNVKGERFSYQGSRLRFVNSRRINVEMGRRDEVETWASSDELFDSVDFCVDAENERFETFGKQEKMFGEINRERRPKHSLEREKEMYRSFREEEEERVSFDDDSNMEKYPFERQGGEGSYPSAAVSDDIMFNEYLMEANALLKEARGYIRSKSDERKVEAMLYNAAKLFLKAIEMKPMSLLGVGQLANTYLLHGELKFKRSRRLRALLVESDEISFKRRGKSIEGTDDWFERRDQIALLLVQACEECEQLLVEAGKKYRLALSIDGNDMRAMYNWGLALSFRAQLIADIGPEAAFDADKIFLAAIDKFDAMMSKSNAYAPDALFRWGVALQQRSRLSPRNRNVKVKLLQQAKRLYEDALDMDSDNLQVREALGSCISELKFKSY